MEQEMSNLFPNGIRALVVDDDARFLASSSTMLSTLNFKVPTCRSLASALRLLNQEKISDDVDAVLVNAEKAVACSFDFHGIVESIMCIPVVYFLPLDHEVTAGDEVITLLLRPGANTIKKPVDANEVCNLWRGIAWRKSYLKAKADQAGGRRVLPDAVVEALLAGGGGRGRKRKSSSSNNPGGSSGTSSLAGNQAAMRQPQMNVTEGRERDNLVSHQQQETRGMETRKDNGKVPMFQQPRAMDGRQPGRQQQQSLFVQSVLRTLNVPPYNPRIYSDTAGLSDNAGAGAGNTDALPPALAVAPPPVNLSPVPVPVPAPAAAPPPVNPSPVPVPVPVPVPAPAPRPVYPAARNVFGATAPASAAVATTAAGCRRPLTSRPFSAPYLQGPPPRVVQQDMFAPGTRGGAGTRRRETGPVTLNFQQPRATAGDVFTGMASGAVMTFGASAAATAHPRAYGNAGCSLLLQSLNLGAAGQDELSGLSAMATMNTGTNSNPPLAPHHAGVASNVPAMDPEMYGNNYCYRSLMAPRRLIDHRVAVAPANQEAAAAMGTLGSDGYIDYSTASSMAPLQAADHGVAAGMEKEEAPDANIFSNYSSSASLLAPDHQVLGVASNVNELTISGGAPFGDDAAAASFTASKDLVAAAPNGDQFAPGALDLDDGDLSGSAMGSLQGPDMAMDGDAGGFAVMSPADQHPASTFSMKELLGPDDQQGGAAANDAAGTSTSPIGGEGGNSTLDIGAAGFDLDGDFILGDLWDLRPQPYNV